MRTPLLAVVLLTGCSLARGPADLAGSYRFTAMNDQPVPVEFPPASGARLESGSLELRSDHRYSMRFESRAPGKDISPSGNDGSYRLRSDTVFFTPDGRETAPPVTFRFERVPGGLRLTDPSGNAWTYARQ